MIDGLTGDCESVGVIDGVSLGVAPNDNVGVLDGVSDGVIVWVAVGLFCGVDVGLGGIERDGVRVG